MPTSLNIGPRGRKGMKATSSTEYLLVGGGTRPDWRV